MFRVVFYTPKGKKSPIEKFLDSSNASLRAKIIRQLKYAQEFGLTPDVPNLRKLTGTSLWELRILGKDNVRIITSNIHKKEIVILHVFKKKEAKNTSKRIECSLGKI